jgi:two-component system, NtrC family, sensor kinase
LKLWIRLAGMMALVSVVPLLFVGLVTVNNWSAEAMRRSLEEQEIQAGWRAEFISSWVDDQVSALEGWMRVPFRIDDSLAMQEGLLRAVFVAVPSVVTVIMVDADGVATVPPVYVSQAATDPDDPTRGRDLGSEARASQLVKQLPLSAALQDGVAVGDPYQPVGSDTASVPVAVARNGLVLGAEVSLEMLRADLYTEGFGEGRVVAVLDRLGRPVVGNPPYVKSQLLRPMLGQRAQVQYALEDGLEINGAVAPVLGTEWTVLVAQASATVKEPARKLQMQTLRMLLVAVALALVAGGVLARSITQPVDLLREVALGVAEGKYGAKAGIQRRDEIGELAQAFDHMSERLQENHVQIDGQRREIEAFNRELQDRVDQRTAELRDAQAQLVRSGQLAAVAEVGAGLAHELNNPLSGILGLAQLLGARGEGHVGDVAAQIEAEAQRCREVVAAMHRIASGEVQMSLQPVVDLNEVLAEVIELVRGGFRQRSLTIDLAPGDAPCNVRLEPVHGARILSQVLNTLRAGMAEGSHLGVSVVRENGKVLVCMKPSEPVVARDDWRASGMGLWVAQHSLHQLGGALDEPEDAMVDPTWRVVLPENPR